jgi:hypothetical protein
MWLLIGLGMWLAALGALVGTLGASGRESRREEASMRRRHLSLVRRPRRPARLSAPEDPAEPEGQRETEQQR